MKAHALLVALLLTVPALARADDGSEDPLRPHYGLAMAGAYLAAPLAGLGTGVLHRQVGLSVFVLTPPVMHIAYADPWLALGSLFGPTVSMLGTAALLIAVSPCHFFAGGLGGGGPGCEGPMLIGALTGYLLWSAFDVTMSSLREGGGHRTPHARAVSGGEGPSSAR